MRDAAKALEISVNTLKKRLSRGRKELAGYLREEWEGELRETLKAPSTGVAASKIVRGLAVGPAWLALMAGVVEKAGAEVAAESGSWHAFEGLRRAFRSSAGRWVAGAVGIGIVSVAVPVFIYGGGPEEEVPGADYAISSTVASSDEESSGVEGGVGESESVVAEASFPALDPAELSSNEALISAGRSWVIEGSVIDGEGQPVKGVRVRAVADTLLAYGWNPFGSEEGSFFSWLRTAERGLARRDLDLYYESRTNSRGRYRLAGSDAAIENVKIVGDYGGFMTDSHNLALADSPIEAPPLTLQSGPQFSSFKGRVVRANGAPVVDAVVEVAASILQGGIGKVSEGAATDDEGRFDLLMSSRGKVSLAASSSSLGEARFNDVQFDPEREETFVWQEPAGLRGRIGRVGYKEGEALYLVVTTGCRLENSGSSISGLIVGTQASLVGPGGNYAIGGIVPGFPNKVVVSDEEGNALTPRISLGEFEEGEDREWNYDLYEVIRLRGLVVGAPSGEPLPGLYLSVLKDGAPARRPEVRADDSGRYDLRLLRGAGAYVIYPHFNILEHHEYLAVNGQEVVVDAGADLTVDLVFPDPVSIRVGSFASTGEGLPTRVGFSVYPADGVPRISKYIDTDDAGRLVWSKLLPGQEVEVVFRAPGYFSETSLKMVGGPGETLEARAYLTQQGGIEGRVVDSDGAAYGVVHLLIHTRANRNPGAIMVRTNKDGYFSSHGRLLPGRWPVELELYEAGVDGNSRGARASLAEVVVEPGFVRDVGVVTLESPGSAN